MKTKYKYIHFEKIAGQWFCYNNKAKSELGRIEYYSRWRQYVIEFEQGCVFNDTCLTDIIHFLRQLQTEHNKPKENKDAQNGKEKNQDERR